MERTRRSLVRVKSTGAQQLLCTLLSTLHGMQLFPWRAIRFTHSFCFSVLHGKGWREEILSSADSKTSFTHTNLLPGVFDKYLTGCDF